MESLLVSDYMNLHPVKLTPDMPVAEAVEALLASHQTGGPVQDPFGKVVGFLSEQDCLKQMIESSYYREQVCRVKDVMQTVVAAVKPWSSVLEVAQRLINERPRIFPVIDDDEKLVGTINRAAVLRAIDKQLQSGYNQKAS
ncbi:CBS domain-containing protein [Alteromonas sp. C1M14]|uniref:CBS domain-containing protein n=1 Tax=Alteromonas sp. C1M14 TaxID=2841567 RepID=UPI001C08F798|nr:CBS domain-containing protein [Alteromonas sp. C1M14]MBU2978984.1 CBS domain-containing protein [Alteromonas sp. C1M14]